MTRGNDYDPPSLPWARVVVMALLAFAGFILAIWAVAWVSDAVLQ